MQAHHIFNSGIKPFAGMAGKTGYDSNNDGLISISIERYVTFPAGAALTFKGSPIPFTAFHRVLIIRRYLNAPPSHDQLPRVFIRTAELVDAIPTHAHAGTR